MKMEPLTLYYLRMLLLAFGISGIVYRLKDYPIEWRGVPGGEGIFYRLRIFLSKNLLREPRWEAYASVSMHLIVFYLVALHLPLYLRFLGAPLNYSLAYSPTPHFWKASLTIAGLILSLALMSRRIAWRQAMVPGQLGLHLILQAILFSWTIYYMTGSPMALESSLISTEAFHAYFWTRAGFHPLAFILRLPASPSIMLRNDRLSLALG